jgi:hypothetical protein
MRSKWLRALVGAAVVASVTFVGPAPARAATDDSFSKCTQGKPCAGRVRFVDSGPGKPGGGNNDDYIVCEDNSGWYVVGCWLWHKGRYEGGVVSSGDSNVVWEPYAKWNVKKGDKIKIKVCLEYPPITDDGWASCDEAERISADG